jgi:hypothetical protein
MVCLVGIGCFPTRSGSGLATHLSGAQAGNAANQQRKYNDNQQYAHLGSPQMS